MQRQATPLIITLAEQIKRVEFATDHSPKKHSNPESPRLYRHLLQHATPRKRKASRHFDTRGPVKSIVFNERMESRFENDYECMGLLGCGNFGEVHKCMNKFDEQTYAIKCIHGTGDTSLKEIRALAALSVKDSEGCLVKYHGAWREEEGLFIVMEYYLKSLKQLKCEKARSHSFFSQHEILKMMKAILTGLAFLHKEHIAHLDIKPENIMVAHDGGLRIADLGHSRLVDGYDYVEEGDSRYMAQDLLNPLPGCDFRQSDIFSFALSMLELMLMVESLPNNGNDWFKLRNNFKASELMQLKLRYSKDLLVILDQALMRHGRPTAKQLLSKLARLGHPKQEKAAPRKLSA